ncbi:MAG: hypothetical protein U1F06_01770 [Steroidobacteraceae bacterium]
MAQTLVTAGTALTGIVVLGFAIQRSPSMTSRRGLGQSAPGGGGGQDRRRTGGDDRAAPRGAGRVRQAAARPLHAIVAANPDIRFAYAGIIDGATMRYVALDVDPSTQLLEADPDPPLAGEVLAWTSQRLVVESEPSCSAWGVGIRAFAPVGDRAGHRVAYVGLIAQRYAATIGGIRSAADRRQRLSLYLAVLSGLAVARIQRQRNQAMDWAVAACRPRASSSPT